MFQEMTLFLMRYTMSKSPIIRESNPPVKEKKMPHFRTFDAK